MLSIRYYLYNTKPLISNKSKKFLKINTNYFHIFYINKIIVFHVLQLYLLINIKTINMHIISSIFS